MKKTFTANLNGNVFHIEEDAYDQLQRYLANIRAKFSGSSEAEEIMADIEARIAELFTERLQGRQAVSLADVDHVKQVMGQPEDYVDGETADERSAGGGSGQTYGSTRRHKRLFRDTDDKKIAGVLSGLGHYFGIDPLWLRIIALIFLLAGWGSPALIYIVLWVLVPEASTAAEKLEMQGEPVTVDNIKRMFDEGTERVKSGGQRMAQEAKDLGRQWGPAARNAGQQASDVLGKLIGVVVLLLAFSLLISVFTGAIGGTVGLWHATWSNADISLLDLGGQVFNSPGHALWFAIGALSLVIIPIMALFLAGFRLLLGTPAPRWLGITLTVLWIIALVPTVWAAVSLGTDYRRENSIRTEAALQQPADGTIYLDMLPPADSSSYGWSFSYDRGRMDVDLEGIHLDNGTTSAAWADVDVEASSDSLFHLLVVRSAHGATAKDARTRAGNVGYDYRQEGDALYLSPVVQFPSKDKLRCQEVRFILQVPNGRSVFLRDGSRRMLDDIANTTNTYDGDMVGHRWTMTPEGLTKGGVPSPARDTTAVPPPPAQESAPAQAPATQVKRQARIAAKQIREEAVASMEGATTYMPNLIELLSAGLRP